MAEDKRKLLYKIARFQQGGKVVDADQTEINAVGFNGNLSTSITDVQQLAQSVDDLNIGSSTGSAEVIGGFEIDIPSRVDLNTDLSGNHIIRYRVYNHNAITSLNVFIDEGGLFSVVSVPSGQLPTGDGLHSSSITLPNIPTSTKRNLNFYLVVNSNEDISNSYFVQVDTIEASEVSVDRTNLGTVQGDDSQDIANELERLYGIVARIQNEQQPSERPLNTFESSQSFPPDNINDFLNRNSLYVRSDNARITFQLPLDSQLTGQYPILIELSHFGGTQRFDSGSNPTNTIRIQRPTDYNPADLGSYLRRTSDTGTNLQFSELHRGDTIILTKEDSGSPWVSIESSTDPRTSILPNGVFQLNSRGITFPTNVNGDHFIGGLALYTPTQGDAFVVIGSGISESSTFGRTIETDDVLVAKVNSPSLLLTSSNDDWLIIRDAGHGEITLSELRFLAQISESDTFTDTRLESRSDVSNVRIFLSPFILDHAPFVFPSTDSNNPQSGETGEYIGGDEVDGASFDFSASTAQVGDFDGVSSSTRAGNALVYVDIDGGFDIQENINDVYIVHSDIDGNEISRHNLSTEFRPIILTGSSDTYYVFDDVAASDNFSSINYLVGQTLNVVLRTTNRRFDLGAAINIIPALKDNSIPIEKLSPNTQALIQADHSLTDVQEAKLNGLQVVGTPTDWTAGDLYVKDNDASSSNDLSHYVNVNQLNGIIPNYERTRSITFLIPNFVTVAGLQRADNTSIKLPVTLIGTILGRQAFTATLPSVTGFNSIFDNIWIVDGIASNLQLTGADDSFKAGFSNLKDDVIAAITATHSSDLPEILQTLAHDLTVTTRTSTNWQTIPRSANNQPVLTRQYAFGWDENRRSFTGNYFEDLTGIDILGFNNNNIFYYPDPLDPLNTAFPGAQSYILNDNVRIRNASGQTAISTSFNKIIAFDYSLQRTLNDSDNLSMLRIGISGTTPLIGLSREEGLYLNIGRGDGGQRSRTVTRNLPATGSGSISYPFGTVGGLPTSGEALFTAPTPNDPLVTYPVAFRVEIRLDNNGNNEGTFTHNFTISDAGADVTTSQFTSSHTILGSPHTQTWDIRYEHNHNHAVFGQQQVIFIDDATPLTNAALVYYITIEYDVTETWNVPASYSREPIDAGSGHDDFGLFDPSRYTTEQPRERNRVILLFQPASLFDISADPEMGVRIVVDGEREGAEGTNDYLINLHRSASELDFSDISFGNNACAVSHIQVYDHDSGHLIGEDGLLNYYNAADRWLGAFRHPTETTDTFNVDGLMKWIGVIGGKDVEVTMVEDAGSSDGYRIKFTEV
jgi:hypothetical protein